MFCSSALLQLVLGVFQAILVSLGKNAQESEIVDRKFGSEEFKNERVKIEDLLSYLKRKL